MAGNNIIPSGFSTTPHPQRQQGYVPNTMAYEAMPLRFMKRNYLVVSHHMRLYTCLEEWCEIKGLIILNMSTRLMGLMYQLIIAEMRYNLISYVPRFVGEERVVLLVGGNVLLREDKCS